MSRSQDAYRLAAMLEAGLRKVGDDYQRAALAIDANPRHRRLVKTANQLLKKYAFDDVVAALELQRAELGALPTELWQVEWVRNGRSYIERIVVVPPPPADLCALYVWFRSYSARALEKGIAFDVPLALYERLQKDKRIADAIRNHSIHYRARQFDRPLRIPAEVVTRWG